MDQAAGVRGGQGRGDLGADAHRDPPGHRAAGEAFGEGTAGEQLHDDVRHPRAVERLVLPVVVDVHDVGVRQPGRGLRLGTDPFPGLAVGGEARGEHLHRHLPAEHLVVGAPHHGHAAHAEPLDDPVPPAEYLNPLHAPQSAPVDG